MRNSRRIKRMSRNRVKLTKMNLTSLMDIFTILVFFLLINSGSVEILDAPKICDTARVARRGQATRDGDDLGQPEEVLVQGEPVALVADILGGKRAALDPIKSRLAQLRENIIGPSTLAVAGSREVTILADKSVPFSVIKTLMSTCTGEGYENVSLAVIQKAASVAAT